MASTNPLSRDRVGRPFTIGDGLDRREATNKHRAKRDNIEPPEGGRALSFVPHFWRLHLWADCGILEEEPDMFL